MVLVGSERMRRIQSMKGRAIGRRRASLRRRERTKRLQVAYHCHDGKIIRKV